MKLIMIIIMMLMMMMLLLLLMMMLLLMMLMMMLMVRLLWRLRPRWAADSSKARCMRSVRETGSSAYATGPRLAILGA